MRQLLIFSDSVVKGVMHENGRYKLCDDHDFTSLNTCGVEAHNYSKMGATIRTGLEIMQRKLTRCDKAIPPLDDLFQGRMAATQDLEKMLRRHISLCEMMIEQTDSY